MKKKTIDEVRKEYNRLRSLFKGVDSSKKKLVDELLRKAAFLKVELDKLEIDIDKSKAIQTSNRGNKRLNPAYRTYLQSLSVYQSIIKTLNIILGKEMDDGDDEFDLFLKEALKQ